MLSVSLAFVLLSLLEVAVRLVAPQDLTGTWAILNTRGYYLNKSGGTARHQLGDRVVHYRFNTDHLRGQPVGSGRRVLVVGDSYTFGWLVAEDATFVARLGALSDLANVEFLNGGVAGWGAADYLAFVEDYGETLHPCAIVAFLNTDDIGSGLRSRLYRLRDGTTDLEACVSPHTPGRFRRFIAESPAIGALLENSHLVQLMRMATLRSEWSSAPQDARRLPVDESRAVTFGQAIFRRLNQWCQRNGSRLIVITTGAERWNAETAAFVRVAPEFFGHEGIPFLDLRPTIRAATRGYHPAFFVPGDTHPNELFHHLIARNAWPWLREQLLGGRQVPVESTADERAETSKH